MDILGTPVRMLSVAFCRVSGNNARDGDDSVEEMGPPTHRRK